MNYKDLMIRSLVAVVGIPVIFGAAIIGDIVFLILTDIIMIAALIEFYSMENKKGVFPFKAAGLLTLLLISIDLYFYLGTHILLIIIIFVIIVLLSELFKKKGGHATNISSTILGVLYTGLLIFLFLLRQLPLKFNLAYSSGGRIIILIFSVIWICDTFAYLYGSMYGKRKLSPEISPRKTIEGAVAGLIGGVVFTVIIGMLILPELKLISFVVIGFIVGTIGQASDLVESIFKREAGVKDSSNILPGHGGFLDRFDNPIITVPVIYMYLYFFGF